MNPNDPMSNPSTELNDAVLKKLKSYRWKGRALTGLALTVGLLSIVTGIVLAWANAMMVMPMERLLYQDYPRALRHGGAKSAQATNEIATAPQGSATPDATNSTALPGTEARPPLSRDELDSRHVQVTFAHGKELFLIAASIAFVGAGTFLTLLLVIFNRHSTLRQLNASLEQISLQLKEIAGRQRS